MTIMAAMFYLLSCVFYVLARLSMEHTVNVMPENGDKSKTIVPLDRVKQGLLMTGSVAAAVLAMKTKEIAVTLPIATILRSRTIGRSPRCVRSLARLSGTVIQEVRSCVIRSISGSDCARARATFREVKKIVKLPLRGPGTVRGAIRTRVRA